MHLPRRTCRIPLSKEQRRALWLYALPGICLDLYAGAVVILVVGMIAVMASTSWMPDGTAALQLATLAGIAAMLGFNETASEMRARAEQALKDLREGHLLVSTDQALLSLSEGIAFAINGVMQAAAPTDIPAVVPGRYYRVAFSPVSRIVWSLVPAPNDGTPVERPSQISRAV